jgi:hypothetical protein
MTIDPSPMDGYGMDDWVVLWCTILVRQPRERLFIFSFQLDLDFSIDNHPPGMFIHMDIGKVQKSVCVQYIKHIPLKNF